MRLAVCLALLAASVSAEIVDRSAIAIGYQVITESAIDEEIRVTDLLNGTAVQLSEAARRAAADRLIQQFLIQRDMQLSRYTIPDTADIDAYDRRVEKALGGSARVSQLLKQYGITKQILSSHLALQLLTLRFVEFRFRPDLTVSSNDVQKFIERHHPGYSDKDRIRQAVVEERVDAALTSWLEQARRRADIVYLDKALR